MYLYLYDSSLSDKKYSSLLAKVETSLTDLGIGGKICRLSPLRNLNELIGDEVKNGIKTIVVVGDDKTLNQVINHAAKYDITLGLIPVGPSNQIAKLLGIKEGEAACEAIAARIVKKIDLGKINDTYFLSGIKIGGGSVVLECEEQYQIKPQQNNVEIAICNFRPALAATANRGNYFNPEDGFLEIFIQPIAKGLFSFFNKNVGQTQRSIIPFKKLAIRSKQSVSITTDGQKVLKTPVKIEIVPKKLRIIVGKSRVF